MAAPDPAFAAEIDAYVSDDDPDPAASQDRKRLARFTNEAMSFLSKAYPSPVDHDRERLRRFHEQAVSFLDRAYAEDPATLVTEEHLPPEQLLQRFHHEAMSFLDVAPAASTAARIERDKARLEQHYQDAMSFLNRADRGRGLVEEQELETATVERFQLQKYAREAMSFLDKAFREDASVMVEDEDISPNKADEDRQIAADRAALERYDEEFGDFLSKAYQDDSTVIVEDADSETSGTERGLFARRMAASTTSAETGYSGSVTQDEDFTDEAYTDDEFQDPEVAAEADPRLEALERNLPAEAARYAPPDSSGDVAPDESNDTLRRRMAEYEREADDYLEGANVSESEDESDGAGDSGDMGHVLIDDDGKRVEHDLHGNARELAADAPDFAEDEDDQFGADRQIEEESQLSPRQPDDRERRESSHSEHEAPSVKFPDRVDMPRDSSGSDMPRGSPDRETQRGSPAREIPRYSPGREAPHGSPGRELPRGSPGRPPLPRGSPISELLKGSPGRALPPSSPDSQDFLVDLILEDKAGQSKQLSEVPLERSFYRQLPRGSTIKLLPKMSPQLSASSRVGSGSTESFGPISLGDLQRVEKERDAALASLEEIVNERSMLAAQVSDMKHMIRKSGAEGDDSKSEEMGDIDLTAELREAHETMSKMTEEMEATLAVLDSRYHETLQRAHTAEEKCIRLEANASRLGSEFASQGRRLSQSITEERRLTSMLNKTEKEFEALRRKSEKDIQRIEDSYREEGDRNMRRIRELSTEVAILQEKLKSDSSSSSDRSVQRSPARRLELEMSSLKRKLGESERKLAEERAVGQKKAEVEVQKAKAERDDEMQKLSSELERMQLEAKNVEALKREVRRYKSDSNKMSAKVDEVEHRLTEVQDELIEARRGQVTAEAEAKHVRLRYEESLKKRISQMDQSSEMIEIQSALQGLREEAASRERSLQRQLEDFRKRAEQAESAAASAETDAREAADVAKRSRMVIESERQARKAAEAEVQRVVAESRAWEKFAQQQMDQAKKSEEAANLAKSSSRRGLRKSPSKSTKDQKRRKDGKAGASEEATRKKNSHRPRLFG